MMTDSKKMTISTYNCKHYKDIKVPYMKKLLDDSDIILIQEHCLYEKQLNELSKLGDVGYHGVSPMNECIPLVGRPFGGCAIVWRNKLNAKFTPIPTHSNRLCAGTFQLSSGFDIFILCVYLPCDDRQRGDSYLELIDTLNEMLCLKNGATANAILVAGDLNTDFTRQTPQVAAVTEFIYLCNRFQAWYKLLKVGCTIYI